MPRPRKQPEPEALEKALRVFWTKGYDRTSINDLSESLGVGPSSIYNAFNSKAELFRRSLTHYGDTHLAFVHQLMDETETEDVRDALRELFHGLVRLYTEASTPKGCAIFQGGGAGGPAATDDAEISRFFRGEVYRNLLTLLDRAPDPARFAAPSSVLAKFLYATLRGVSQMAVDGASRRELLAIADHAVASCFVDPTLTRCK